jgi:pimeloyl-ACP methyl ester carboxylesterase
MVHRIRIKVRDVLQGEETMQYLGRIHQIFGVWENKFSYFNAKNVSVPTAVSVFPGEQYHAPRSWTERAYPQLIYYNRVDKGGHFAAWEQPQLFSDEIRAAFRSPRSSWPAALIQNWL